MWLMPKMPCFKENRAFFVALPDFAVLKYLSMAHMCTSYKDTRKHVYALEGQGEK